MKKNNFFVNNTNDKTPVKKSLSPRNKDFRQELDFKKPISPVSHKKQSENHDNPSSQDVKISVKLLNQKS